MIYTYYADPGGWRFVVLFHQGRKWLQALDLSTLDVYRLPVTKRGHLVPVRASRPKTTARRLAAKRAQFKRLGISFPKRAVARSIDALRDSPN